LDLKGFERKARILESVEKRFPNLESNVKHELAEITYEQDRVFSSSAKNFVGYVLFGLILTGPVVWLLVVLFESFQWQLLSSIVVCTSIIIGLVIMIGYNIYSRVARIELYLNTLHQELSNRNET